MSDSSNVRVAVRVRPLSSKEQLEGSRRIVQVVNKLNQVVVGTDRGFTFDHAYDDRSTQDAIFEECIRPLVDSAMEGYNATVFAYGQTGSGKTYTMGTCENAHVEPDVLGMVPRAVEYLYQRIDSWQHETENPVVLHRTVEKMKDDTNRSTLKVRASFYEIHLENVQDLLQPEHTSSANNVQIRADASGKVIISGLRLVTVKSASHLQDLLEMGSIRRSTGSTDMNQYSSRSHAIFTIYVDQHIVHNPSVKSDLADDVDSDAQLALPESRAQPPTRLSAKFHFVDLAGSERAKRSGAEGNTFKEAVQINQGLLSLGNVISALGDRKKHGVHVPFRDSKLTRILQDSLGGNSRTLMIACISPSSTDIAETLNTLKYANRARNIRNQPIKNEHREELALQVQLDNVQRQLLVLERERQSELQKQQRNSAIRPEDEAQREARDAHIADLEEKLGGLYKRAKESSTLLREHVVRATRLCDDIRLSLGPDADDAGIQTSNVPAAALGDAPKNSSVVPVGNVRMFGAAVLHRLEQLSREASIAAESAEQALNTQSVNGDSIAQHEGATGADSEQVSALKQALQEAQAELERDEIIFASKNEEVLALQHQLRDQIVATNELQDEIDHLHWQLTNAQHQHQDSAQKAWQPQPGGWATSVFADDDDGVLMADADDETPASATSDLMRDNQSNSNSVDRQDLRARHISTSPIDFDRTFSANGGRQLRNHFEDAHAERQHRGQTSRSISPLAKPSDGASESLKTPPKARADGFTTEAIGGASSSDEKRVRQLQRRIEQQDAEIVARQEKHERDMQNLRIEMRQKQDLINKLTYEEQMSTVALEEHGAQIAQLEEDIDMYESELRRAADELGRASQTELEHQRRQAEAARNEHLLQEAEGQLKKLRKAQQLQRKSTATAARSDGAREELLQMKRRQVAMMRQFKLDEAARRADAQSLKQQLARLRRRRDQQDLEISRLRESNKKQQSVIQAKDDLLRTFKQSARSPSSAAAPAAAAAAAARRASGSNVRGGSSSTESSFVAPSPKSAGKRSRSRKRSSSGGGDETTLAAETVKSPQASLAWLQDSLLSLTAQLQAQHKLDTRLSDLRQALGQQESKNAERQHLSKLAAARGQLALDQTMNTFGRNLDAVVAAADQASAVAGVSSKHIEEIDEELDAIGLNVAHIQQEVAAARQQAAAGLTFKKIVEGLNGLSPSASALCLRWVAQTMPDLQAQVDLKTKALKQMEGTLREMEENGRRLQNKMVKQQVDYNAQIARLQDKIQRLQKASETTLRADGSNNVEHGAAAASSSTSASTLQDIRSRMGDILHTTYREGKMNDETKHNSDQIGALAGGPAGGERGSEKQHVERLRQQLRKEREARQNEIRRMNRYRWEREKLRKQLADVQAQHEKEKQEWMAAAGSNAGASSAADEVEAVTQDLQAALEDCVFYKAQNKELKRKVKELGHSLARYSGK